MVERTQPCCVAAEHVAVAAAAAAEDVVVVAAEHVVVVAAAAVVCSVASKHSLLVKHRIVAVFVYTRAGPALEPVASTGSLTELDTEKKMFGRLHWSHFAAAAAAAAAEYGSDHYLLRRRSYCFGLIVGGTLGQAREVEPASAKGMGCSLEPRGCSTWHPELRRGLVERELEQLPLEYTYALSSNRPGW